MTTQPNQGEYRSQPWDGGQAPRPGGGVAWHREIPSDPARLREVRLGLEQFIRQSGFDEKTTGEIALCVNEALANVMRHAYHGRCDRPISIDARCDRQGVRLSIRDWGDGFDPAAAMQREYNPEQPGGIGLICLCKLMDEVKYHPQPQGTLLTMSRRK